MPGFFGNPTPQEVQAQIAESFQQRHAQAVATTPFKSRGARLGNALSGIFGQSIRKSIETRGARKSEAARLVEQTGMSVQEARAAAKENIGRDFNAVRKAKGVQKASGIAQQVVQQQTPNIGAAKAKAQGMRVMSIQLRQMGLIDEATNLSMQATQLDQAEDARLAAIEKQKVALSATKASTENTIADTERLGSTPMMDLSTQENDLISQIEASSDPSEVVALERTLENIQGEIAKRKFFGGLTPTDAEVRGLTGPVETALQTSLIDSDNQLGLLTSIGDTVKPQFLTFFGTVKDFAVTGLEKLSVTPTKEQAKFVTEFNTFKRNGVDGLNRYIKLITGAQMSEAEADRLRLGFPDVQNDSYTKFIAKYESTVQQLMAVRERARAALADPSILLQPLGGFQVPVTDVRKLLKTTTKQPEPQEPEQQQAPKDPASMTTEELIKEANATN